MELKDIDCGMLVLLNGSDRKLCVSSKGDDNTVLCVWRSNDGSHQSAWYKPAMLNPAPEKNGVGFKP
jgi:hypothetical protein